MEYNKNRIALLWLSSINFISEKKKYEIYTYFESGENLFDINNRKKEWLQFVSDDTYCKLLASCNEIYIKGKIVNLEKTDIKFITIEDDEYPFLLKQINDPPIVLYYKGDITLLNTRCLAIIGTRDYDSYGVDVTKKFSSALASNGFTITGDLAEGLGGLAHETCVKAGGKTIAVLPCGLDKIYPNIYLNLSKKILETGGLLLSEKEPFYRAKKFDYPQRSRIVAGISEVVLLTEAPEQSGTRFTIEFAVDYNRTVYVVPGEVTNRRCVYNNRLIKSCATCIAITPEDIMKELNVKYVTKSKVSFTPEQELVLKAIGSDKEVHYNFILNSTKLDANKVNSILTYFELNDKIVKSAGNMYRLY